MDGIFNEEAMEAFRKLNLAAAVSAYFDGSTRYMQSEIAFRQAQRLQRLGFQPAVVRNQQRIADAMNAQGLAYHERVIVEIAAARKSWDAKLVSEIDAAVKGRKFQRSLSQAREIFVDVLVDRDFSPEDASDVIQQWDRTAKLVLAKGLSGLVDEWLTATKTLRDLRMKPGRGREPASPLSTWHKACIAVAIGVGIAAVVSCFWWSSCSWVWSALRAAGGWCAECCLGSTGGEIGGGGAAGDPWPGGLRRMK